MTGHSARVPELIPQLSRGKHRNPRKGACFMELVSYLAGERWTDHPPCTHPLLAALARLVNDYTTDEGRRHLVELAPSVVGLTSDDPHLEVRIMLRAAQTALPVVSAERQRMMAVAVLAGERVLDSLDHRAPGTLGQPSREALAQVPDAARWARRFHRSLGSTVDDVRRQGAPNAIRQAVVGIAEACVPDPDGLLRELLVGAIGDCERSVGRTHPAHPADAAHGPRRAPAEATAAGAPR